MHPSLEAEPANTDVNDVGVLQETVENIQTDP
jgi:hypothetical protein